MGKKTKNQKRAKKASGINTRSEENFVDRLKKRGFTANRTGKAEGIPDIIAWKKNKILEFYEIKPGGVKKGKKGGAKGNAAALLKDTQKEWIKNYCFKKGIKVTLVYYQGLRSFKYHDIKLDQKNISNFSIGTKGMDILQRTREFTYS